MKNESRVSKLQTRPYEDHKVIALSDSGYETNDEAREENEDECT